MSKHQSAEEAAAEEVARKADHYGRTYVRQAFLYQWYSALARVWRAKEDSGADEFDFGGSWLIVDDTARAIIVKMLKAAGFETDDELVCVEVYLRKLLGKRLARYGLVLKLGEVDFVGPGYPRIFYLVPAQDTVPA